jgi:hypothetical protein
MIWIIDYTLHILGDLAGTAVHVTRRLITFAPMA